MDFFGYSIPEHEEDIGARSRSFLMRVMLELVGSVWVGMNVGCGFWFFTDLIF